MSGRQNIETIVGLAVVAFCILLLVIVYRDGLFGGGKSYYTLNTTFERADGINLGSDVAISGVKIGEVKQKRIDPNNYNAIVTITVEKGLKLPIDTSAEITSATLLGDKYISIVPGAEKDILKEGDTIEFTQSSINIEGLITKFFFGLDAPKSDSAQEAPSS